MNFIKMHGIGNDFVIIKADSWDAAAEYQKNAPLVCNRNFGIGADGLAVFGPDTEDGIFMRIFNPDGSEPEMCGNAIRCVSRLVYEQGLVNKTSFAVKTLAGIKYPEIILNQRHEITSVKVDMGEPVLERSQIPMLGEGDTIARPLQAAGENFVITGVSMGNPHCVIFVEDINKVPLQEWGPVLEKHELFPAYTNVEFVQIINDQEMIMRVWERGAGITLACGTGACATLVAAVLNNKTGRKACIHLLGGDLNIEWKQDNNHVYMDGNAAHVFQGQTDLLFT